MTGDYLEFENQKYGVCDLNGNILCPPQINSVSIRLSDDRKMIIGAYKGKEINIPINYYDGITMFDYTPYEDLYYSFTEYSSSSSSPSSSSSNSSSSSSSSSSFNSSSGTTQTVIVEHHRDPVPVQEWQACFGCGGMGTMGCDNCGGSGTKYIGDRLHRCSRCNGGGIIPCNVCYGNKGKYVTVYR